MAQENLNPFEISQRQFDTAAEKIGLDDGMREVLRNPQAPADRLRAHADGRRQS